MSQDSATAAAANVVGGSNGSTRSATPTQTAVNIGSAYPPMSTLLNHPGLRYPICLQGGSLIYSPMMGFPWRPFTPVATPTTPVSAAVVPNNMSLMSTPTQTTPSKPVSLASLMQVPNYSYMTVSSLLGSSSSTNSPPIEETTQQYAGIKIKRESSDVQSPQQNIKRPHLVQEEDGSQNSPVSSAAVQSGSSTASPTDIASYYHQQVAASLMRFGSLGDYSTHPPINIVLLKCLGMVEGAYVEQYNVKTLSLLQDLYSPSRPSYGNSPTTLPPETHILLTTNYLNSLHAGECMSIELMKWSFQNALVSETQWVNYYRKHKKMTESTFVQLQFSHFARVSSHLSTSNVMVVVSQSSLSDAIIMTLQGIMKSNRSLLPKFFVVVAILQNVPSEMCILVTDELQCRWLMEIQRSMKPYRDTVHQRLSLCREILTNMKRSQLNLKGTVHSPFFIPGGKELVTKEDAGRMLPPFSNTVEHMPSGPFTGLYDMGLLMLQRVLNAGHLDRYQKLDFFVISPTYPPLVAQLVKDIQESGLIQLLGIGNHRDEILQAITRRIVKCSPTSIKSMNSVIQDNKHVMFLIISKCSHLTSFVTLSQRGRASDANATLDDDRTCDCRSITTHQNTTIFYTSAQPYALQTNRSLIIAANEIHWPFPSSKQICSQPDMSSGLEYCSLLKYKSSVPVDSWADVREDCAFEDQVVKLCSTEKIATPICVIRAQALLSDYALALVSVVRKLRGPCSSLPETRSIVYELVQQPMSSLRGHGSMAVIRCHDRSIGTDLFNKLKAVRNTLGLQYRFEIILDHGDEGITISDHFQKRLNSWGVVEGGASSISYLDLERLPCLVIMTGRVRPSARLPRSLSHVDLRLCHTPLTRTVFESDLSLMSSYRHVASPRTLKHQSSLNSYKSGKHTSTASSSSMLSGDAHVVEWKPSKDVTLDHAHWDKNIHSPSYKAQFEYNNTDMECSDSPAINGGVAIVEIPQPEDHMATAFNDPVNDVEESIFNDLDSESDYDESETETDDGTQRRITCLLSRQYHRIWKSGAVVDQSLLLPPSDGVVWQASSKWAHLSDHTHSVQSSYYRTWSKPEGKVKRVAMDAFIKENNEGRQRGFLLTGPAQVGKTGACLLLVRLLHEYMRSCRGVTAVSKSPTVLPLVRHTPLLSPVATSFSPVVSVDYLISGRDGDTPFPYHPAAEDVKQNTVLISAHPTIVHDSSHSCPKCSSAPPSNETTPVNYTLSSLLQCGSASVTVQWSIPSAKADLLVMASNHIIECIKLPLTTSDPDTPSHFNVPIFSISPDLKGSALLNLSHTAENHFHVVVTKSSNFSSYQNVWPSHIIAALPDSVFSGVGSCMNAVKSLGQWNYVQNTFRVKCTATLSPWMLILSDTVCMVLKDTDEKSVDLSSVLEELIREDADLFSLRHWSHCSDALPLQNYALDSNILLLNLSKLHDFNYNPFNFKSADIDYHLRLLGNGYTVSIPNRFTFVRKHIKPDGPVSLADLSPQLISHPDKLVTSLHHDISSLLSYPGPLLLETFLLHKSQSLFPSAHSPSHPVLMIENYINLGPQVHVSLMSCKQLEEMVDQAVFGGLVLYLCEGLVSSEMLQRLKFAPGACLLLVTRDCKALVREVSRLDIEEYWHFKLRDEFQTSCRDLHQPLFFLTGKYMSSNTDVS